MADCPNQKKNISGCNCTYDPCSRKGFCCECLVYHRKSQELPACYFTTAEEKTYDRSIANFNRAKK